MPTDLRRVKSELREAMKARRAKALANNPRVSLQLRDQFLKQISLPPQSIVAGTSVFGSEIDTTPLLNALREMGHIIVLPVVVGRGQELQFRRYMSGDPLAIGIVGVPEPLSTAKVLVPDVMLVPLLAFDRQCHRLGYGGGYYDRTITQIRTHKPLMVLGFGFDCQMVPEVPRGRHDMQLDKIITETSVFSC